MHRAPPARLAAVFALASLAACGGKDEVTLDASQMPDASSGMADAGVADAAAADANAVMCPVAAAGEVGGSCDKQSDCDSPDGGANGFCLDETLSINGPSDGFCAQFGCETNGCPDGTTCVDISDPPGSSNFFVCLPECCETDICPPNQVCGTRYFGQATGSTFCLPGDPDAADGDPCTSVADCNASSLCRDDPYVFPGGFCQGVGCTVGDNGTCAGGGRCIDLDGIGGDPSFCVANCQDDSDCRQNEGYFCRDLSAQGFGKFCDHHEVGETCSADTDCGLSPPWTCAQESDGFTGNYCTVVDCDPDNPGTSCPIRSNCYDDGNGTPFCAAQCDQNDPSPCRDGYDCIEVVGSDPPKYGCVPAG